MAEILISGATGIIIKLVGAVAHEIGSLWGVKEDMKKLHNTLEMILAKIADAEEKQVKNHELRLWLKRLKDVAYDVEDMMDDFSYETMRLQEKHSFKDKARDFVSSSNPLTLRRKLAKKIQYINKRVDEIAKDMGKFQLQTTSTNTTTGHGQSIEQWGWQTASFINDSEIVGRKDDKNKIVDMLTNATTLSSSDANQFLEKVSIISIVGMGGLGKTTLAQLVYKDELVVKHFDQRIWVCVFKDFNVENVLIKIMESITLAKFDNVLNFDLLVNKVQEKLQGKKYLLVLDDLWNENVQQWERLKSSLLVGSQGSKILITTRNIQVADVVKGSIRPYILEKLHEDECWSIMEKRAFSPGGAPRTANMKNMGNEIAIKCSGLPLAAKFLGSLMHSKNKESDWFLIRESDIWNTQEGQSEIRPILKLSYDNLSPHLKQCFSYCSIFPKGWEIKRETLIQLWMAEGFLEPLSNVGSEGSIEDTGEKYFDSLVRSSFLDVVKKNDLDDIISCKMHDLVHDLARDVIGERECAIVKVSELEKITDIRRLQLILDDKLSATPPKASSEMKTLRTILIIQPNYVLNLHRFSSNKHLRILHLGFPTWISYSTAKLRHLRYFNLSSSIFSGTMDHDVSISRLYNLQTLVLSECRRVRNLLENMGSLKNLRQLDISFTDIEDLPDSVTSLCNLQRLDLNHCNNLATFPTSVTGLKFLKFLNLSFTPIEELPAFVITLTSLQTLDVTSCKHLKALPEYVVNLANLRIFNFRNCPLLKKLPNDFGALTYLRCLDLRDTNIKVLPKSLSNLNNLEYVHLFWCELPKVVKNWRKLRKFIYFTVGTPIGIKELVGLQCLTYWVPEKLINRPEYDDGIEELGNLNFLEDLGIFRLENVKEPIDVERANLNRKLNLRQLTLSWGERVESAGMRWDQRSFNFQVFEAIRPPTSLRWLTIRYFLGCDLPTWMCLPNLETLDLINCKGFEQLPAVIGQLPRLIVLKLTGLSLKSLGIGGLPLLIQLSLTDMFLLEDLCSSYPSLQCLIINGCKSLTRLPLFPSLKVLKLENIDCKLVSSIGRNQTSLMKLHIHNVDEFISFPVGILQNNRNLQILQIKECSQFQGFRVNSEENETALFGSHSGCVQSLELVDCLALKFLPDLRGWTSLRKLTIFKCPQVKKSLTYDLKSLSFVVELWVDFIQSDEQRGDPSELGGLINLMIKYELNTYGRMTA